MTSHSADRIEDRLRVLDLQLESPGPHLEDERLAEIQHGDDPSRAEAAHLAGCDECLELLTALGEGLELLAEDDAALAALVTAPTPRGDRGRRVAALPVGLGVLALTAVAAAAVGYALNEESPVSVVVPVTSPERAAPAVAPPSKAAPEVEPTPAVVEEPPAAALPEPTAIPVYPAPEPLRPAPASAAPVVAKTPARPAVALPTTRGALARTDGPKKLVRGAVDGPPQGWGWIRLNSKPKAKVFIDGKLRGWTPVVDLRLPEGPHDVRLVYESPLAAEPEQRFRMVVQPDLVVRATKENIKR